MDTNSDAAVVYSAGEHMADNPFSQPRENRSITVTFRMTPTEHRVVKNAADARGVEIVDLIREGLGHVLARVAQQQPPRARGKERKP